MKYNKVFKCKTIETYRNNIEKRKKEIKSLQEEINKLIDMCSHDIYVLLDKKDFNYYNDRYESNYIECLICGKSIDNIKDKELVIDMSPMYSDITDKEERIKLRRDYARNLYINYYYDEDNQKDIVTNIQETVNNSKKNNEKVKKYWINS